MSYTIQDYNDRELFEILDLVNPSDKVLEAKIIQMIKIHSNDIEISSFFTSMYHHFFDNNVDDDDNDNYNSNNNTEIKEGFDNSSSDSEKILITNKDILTSKDNSFDNKYKVHINDISDSQLPSITYGNNNNGNVENINIDNIIENKSTSLPVNSVVYKKDYINPILQQTIKRIISIDSQYRNLTTYSLSTDFTVNLSEPLKDVVQLSLYSIQIPLTWYTISNAYGANFFYLKAISDGINNGYYDYQIDISAGNYSPQTLVSSVNTSISQLATKNSDVNFGTTGISYNLITSNINAVIDVHHLFNENNYKLNFTNWSSPTNESTRYSDVLGGTLASFLGYNFQSYTPDTIYSQRTLPSQNNNSIDTSYSSYAIDLSNNYFYIYQYLSTFDTDGTLNLWDGVSFLKQIKITLSLTIGASYNRTTILTDLVNQLSLCIYLKESTITREYVLDSSGNNTNSFYAMKLQLNPKNTQNIANSKLVVVFPNEPSTSSSRPYKIWTTDMSFGGYPSCFSFTNLTNAVNSIVAETNTLQSNYIITSSPYFVLKCTTNGYVDLSGNFDYGNISTHSGYNSFNDYIVKVPNSSITSSGYSLPSYLSAITNGFATTNGNIVTIVNGNIVRQSPIFNTTNSLAFDNISSNNLVNISVDLNKIFTTPQYNINFISSTASYNLSTILGFTGNSIFDLGTVSTFSSVNQVIPNSYNTSNIHLMDIYPKTGEDGLTSTNIWNISTYINSSLNNSLNLSQFRDYINNAIQSFQDIPGSFPLSNSLFSYTTNISGSVNYFLTINIQKYLTQNDYSLIFYDPLVIGSGWDTTINNSWYSNLFFLNQVNPLGGNAHVLGTSYSKISGSSIKSDYIFNILEDTSFVLKATGSGVSTSSGVYDISINIPAATDAISGRTIITSYTRGEIFQIINKALANNALTSGSYFTTTLNNSLSYVIFHVNINKIFSAKDYNLVFFDPYSFVKCYSGTSSVRNATWDSTLGWTLGFRAKTVYALSNYYDATSEIVMIMGDTTATSTQFNYFLIVLDDYTQSHLNDGLVTLTTQEKNLQFPSYAPKAITCASSNNLSSFVSNTNTGNRLTQNQIYSAIQIYENSLNTTKIISSGPFIQNIFGLIPMKIVGIPNGSTYTEFGGTLQNQNRIYFGPVNIHRLSIKLVNDKGDIVDLNGSNWSFSFICEQLYQQSSL